MGTDGVALQFSAQKVMTLRVLVGQKKTVGQVPEGWLVIIPILGGSFEGPNIRGRVCPGGADWYVTQSETRCHVLARYWIETDDGAVLSIENEGWLDTRERDAVIRTNPRILCDLNGPYASLVGYNYIGELCGIAPDCVEVTIWKLN